MDTHQVLEKIKESGVAPGEVWYLATLILTGVLIIFIGALTFFVKGFFSDLRETINDLKTNIHFLTEMVTRHDVDMKNVKDDIDELKRRPRR